ncbi:IspD/TarI family cytidylyltransferase [Methanobrevibacter ruminantium]|uniref:IspD/TarI family cytidylyltransferase n=1 Tax=Methanobrevibacter ruminantium TaxID=83816 RepID=UPI002D7ED25C|nr:2-C-methyl-D-erythritol 4-phosphate cytidylyltransferase [Methanobrevibacter ruminantium]
MIYGAVLAGGTGERLGLGMPKQFYKIGNKPILIHSVEAFLKVEEFDYVIVSSPKDYIDKTKELIDEYIENTEKIIVIEGGVTRNDTILNSIDQTDKEEESIMVTHDGARIFVSPEQIQKSIDCAKEHTASCPVIPSTDVIFQSIDKKHLDEIPLRKNLMRAQTPQAFKITRFIEIYNDLSDDEIKLLDEAMALFHLRNEDICLFEGDPSNFKITNPFDIDVAETMINKRK